MSTTTTLRRFALLLALGATPACGDAAGEGGLEAAYVLIEMNSQPLAYDPPGGCCIYSQGSLTLLGGNYTVSLTVHDKSSSMLSIITEQGTYAISGTSVTFQRTAGGTFNFYLFNGLLNGRVIRVQLGGSGPGASDQFATAFRR